MKRQIKRKRNERKPDEDSDAGRVECREVFAAGFIRAENHVHLFRFTAGCDGVSVYLCMCVCVCVVAIQSATITLTVSGGGEEGNAMTPKRR